jgi:hypothetical protein
LKNNIVFSGTISQPNAEKALNIIEKLEEVSNIRELTSLLVKN